MKGFLASAITGLLVIGLPVIGQAEVPLLQRMAERRALSLLAEDLLYPDQAKVRGLKGGVDDQGNMTVCGFVFPMQGDGLRGRQRVFEVEMNREGWHRTWIEGDHEFSGDAIIELCEKRGATGLSYVGEESDVPRFIRDYHPG